MNVPSPAATLLPTRSSSSVLRASNLELRTSNSCVEDGARGADGVAVYLDGVGDVFGVAAGHDGGDGEAAVAAGREHELVAGAQAVDGEREAPELVARVRVRAAEVEDDVGRVVEDAREVVSERGEVFFVARPVVEFHVERR